MTRIDSEALEARLPRMTRQQVETEMNRIKRGKDEIDPVSTGTDHVDHGRVPRDSPHKKWR